MIAKMNFSIMLEAFAEQALRRKVWIKKSKIEKSGNVNDRVFETQTQLIHRHEINLRQTPRQLLGMKQLRDWRYLLLPSTQ